MLLRAPKSHRTQQNGVDYCRGGISGLQSQSSKISRRFLEDPCMGQDFEHGRKTFYGAPLEPTLQLDLRNSTRASTAPPLPTSPCLGSPRELAKYSSICVLESICHAGSTLSCHKLGRHLPLHSPTPFKPVSDFTAPFCMQSDPVRSWRNELECTQICKLSAQTEGTSCRTTTHGRTSA